MQSGPPCCASWLLYNQVNRAPAPGPCPPARAGPEQRCRALLLLYGLIFGCLLPLLLLVPLRGSPEGAAQARDARGRPGLSRVTRWLELGVERCLGLLRRSPAILQHPYSPAVAHPTLSVLVLRWWGLLVSLWTACCLLEG
jgi:hypothetical protein